MKLCHMVDSSLQVGTSRYCVFLPFRTWGCRPSHIQTAGRCPTLPTILMSDCTGGSFPFSKRCKATVMTTTPFLHRLSPAKLHVILLSISTRGNQRVHFNDIQNRNTLSLSPDPRFIQSFLQHTFHSFSKENRDDTLCLRTQKLELYSPGPILCINFVAYSRTITQSTLKLPQIKVLN